MPSPQSIEQRSVRENRKKHKRSIAKASRRKNRSKK